MWTKLWDLINGHKTDLIAGVLVVLAVLILKGIGIPVWLILILGAGGLVALRDAIRKNQKK